MSINYDHLSNVHTQEGPRAALPYVFLDWKPTSLLDIGCGFGTWLKAALDFGISDIFGVDGVAIPEDQLLISSTLFQQHDLTRPINLGRRFDVCLCLEVAEHLDKKYSWTLVKTLADHANVVIFSAAPPSQPGQHHINCQWPTYWQELFNKVGFVCSDEIRWRIWNDSAIEPWYQQNMFIARYEPSKAGTEERIKSVIHPRLLPTIENYIAMNAQSEQLSRIESGKMSVGWYLKVPLKCWYAKKEKIVDGDGQLNNKTV